MKLSEQLTQYTQSQIPVHQDMSELIYKVELLKALELACKQLHDLDVDNLFGDSVKPEYWLDVAQADY